MHTLSNAMSIGTNSNPFTSSHQEVNTITTGDNQYD
jgi:hypothetical protein